jgi:hypothetical protein
VGKKEVRISLFDEREIKIINIILNIVCGLRRFIRFKLEGWIVEFLFAARGYFPSESALEQPLPFVFARLGDLLAGGKAVLH